ncbi:MAG: BTAD domain-containing putative transcriptional regulator, partial [Anaerolineales bacterium]|nr:BTAD domain-containing putative transcriptional regulator [Anaerolineales bacterium]
KRALIFADSSVVYRDFYATKPAENLKQIRLDVRSLGPGFVSLEEVPIASWEGNLPRLLLFLILEKPAVSRSEICTALWPGLDDQQAVNIFHVTKRRLHKALGGQDEHFPILAHHQGRYFLAETVSLSHDVREFATALLHARFDPSCDRALWLSRAINIYSGSYLQGHNEEWIVRRRKDYQEGFIEALTWLAEIREAEQRADIALQYRLRAADTAPARIELHRDVIRTYLKLGRRSEAAVYLNRLVTIASQKDFDLPLAFVQEQRLLIDQP